MKTKTKTKFLSLLLALFMFLVSIATLGVAITANADGGNNPIQPYMNYEFPAYIPDSQYVANPDSDLTSLYYFSDYEKSEEFFETGYIRNYINRNNNISKDSNGNPDAHLYFYQPDFFWQWIVTFFSSIDYTDVSNAFVIFEVRYGIPQRYIKFEDAEELESATTIYDFLNYMFSELKGRGCKIMFICGTEEGRFKNYNDFLDYVDIHINADLFTPYFYTTIKRMEMENGGEWAGTTIVLDISMKKSWEFFKYLILYFVYQIKNKTAIGNPQAVLECLGVNVYFFNPDTEVYVNPYSQSSECTFGDIWMESINRFAVKGSVTAANDYFSDLFSETGTEGLEFPFNLNWDGIEYYITVIMRDFILNDADSLIQYDNWGGRCAVTYRPFFFSADGWLLFPFDWEWNEVWQWFQNLLVLPELEDEDALYDFLISDPPEFAQWG